MKKRVIITAVAALFFSISAKSQIYTRYTQSFEPSETVNYTLSGVAGTDTALYSDGIRSLHLDQSLTNEAVIILDTIDLSDQPNLQYATLEFMHICKVRSQSCINPPSGGMIEVKLATTSGGWTQLQGSQYDMTWGGGSTDFNLNGYFSDWSYNGPWDAGNNTTPTNQWWRKERFVLSGLLNGVSQQNRKLIIRFRLPQLLNGNVEKYEGWYIDNIVVKASASSMTTPSLHMISYPTLTEIPYSRDMLISADISTSALQGMNSDSIYILYKLGASPLYRTTMTKVAGSTIYEGYIPFCGYDTLVSYRIMAKDSSSNQNYITYPSNESAFAKYRCVRGVEQETPLYSGTTSTSADHPFPNKADAAMEYVFDRATMLDAGYTYGAITKLAFQTVTGGNSQINNLNIRMLNVDTSHITSATNAFSTDEMATVFSGNITLRAGANAWTEIPIDTFYYAGQDILVQICYDNSFDPNTTEIKMFPTALNKSSLYITTNASSNYNGCNLINLIGIGNVSDKRPNIRFTSVLNQPLKLDLGIDSITSPATVTSANTPTPIVVRLRNYGTNPVNGTTIFFKVDNNPVQSFNWTGTIAGLSTASVQVTGTEVFAKGFKHIIAWTADSMTVAGQRYRDHEPYNDTASATLIACDGPMAGTRQIGGTNPDYNTIDEFLEALYRCGVGGNLTVNLAPGIYNQQINMPPVAGVSASSSITFRPLNGDTNSVIVRVPGNESCALNMDSSKYVTFDGIRFETSRRAAGTTTALVRFSKNSNHCTLQRCQFIDSTTANLTHLVNTNGMSHITINRCYFSGGATALQMVGSDTVNRPTENVVLNSYFYMPKNTALRLENQTSAVVDSNYFYSSQTNTSAVVLVAHCYDSTRITRNRIFTSNGAYGLNISAVVGPANAKALVANNMIEAASASTSGIFNSPVEITDVNRLSFVYNSVNLDIPNRTNISAAIIGGTGSFTDVQIVNNIFASTTGTGNYTLNFNPLQDTTFVIHHNNYYNAVSYMLNQFNGLATLWADWQNYVPRDTASLTLAPVFLGSYPADLRTYTHFLQGKGIAIAETTSDIERQTRANPPCMGAFEFPPLDYNYGITELLAPETSCSLSTAEHFKVVITNTGVSTVAANSATIQFQMAGGMPSTPERITRAIAPGDTIHFTFANTANLSPESNGADSVFQFRFWTNFAQEVDHSNDTLNAQLLALYQLPKLPTLNLAYNYASMQTININSSDSVYWYTNNTIGTEPFHKGRSYTTGRLYRDTTFYVAHFHEQPEIRITEVQIYKDRDGVTNPYPAWMSSTTTFAVEISNLGNYPVSLGGDTLSTVSTTTLVNNKHYIFPNITLNPNSAVVLQYSSGAQNDSVTCHFGSTLSPQYSTRLGLIYKRRGKGIVDAVAINNIIGQNAWTSLNIPTSICSGYVSMTNTSAGIRRINPTDPTGNGWTVCNNANRMTIGRMESNISLVPDNGCPGYRTPVNIHVTNVPPVNIGITSISVPNEGCSLYNEPVTITLVNLGSSPANNVQLQYRVGNNPYQAIETVQQQIAPYQTISYTFNTLANLSNHRNDTIFTITARLVPVSGDSDRSNDTLSIRIPSFYTPQQPVVTPSVQTVAYGSSGIVYDNSHNDTIVWYDKYGTALDTGYRFTTPLMYQNDTFYAAGISTTTTGVQLGNFEASSVSGYPSAYHCGIKYRKEQYLITAEELRALPNHDRPITSIAFYLDSVRTLSGNATFSDYTISIGTTNISEYSSTNSWQPAMQVYHSNLTISNADRGWVEHKLNAPLVWDGISNIVIQVCYTVSSPASSASVAYTTTNHVSAIYSHSSTTNQTNATGVNGRSNHRPDIRFGFATYNCLGLQTPFYVNVTTPPTTDAALLGVANLAAAGNNAGISQPVKVILKNFGISPLQNASITWNVDSGSYSTYNWAGTLNHLDTAEVYVGDYVFGPGNHCVNAFVSAVGDSYATNDTMQSCMLFCFDKTPRTIGTGGYFASFSDAVDALNNCGICDSVTLVALPGTYNEQIELAQISGMSDTTPITIKSSTGNAQDVILNYSATSNNDDYVVKLNNTNNINIEGITIAATGSQQANAVVVYSSRKINLDNDSIVSNPSANNPASSAISLSGTCQDILLNNNGTNGGYYALNDYSIATHVQGLTVRDNRFNNFSAGGICLQNSDNIDITHNQVRSAKAVSGSMKGISIGNYSGDFDLQRNQVVLKGNGDANAIRQGIDIANSHGSSQYPIRMFNNMVSVVASFAYDNASAAIHIENSNYVNAYYNTTRIGGNINAQATRGFETFGSQNIKLMNNIFSNFTGGYACFVDSLQSIGSSNYNDYYTATSTFVYWQGNHPDTTALRAFTSQDAYSFKQEPFFISPDDLHLAYSTIVETGQYTNEVTVDIDSNPRPQNIRPCVGAHEIPHLQHDISVDNILYPVLSSQPVESDRLMVVARFYNNGRNNEQNITWHAEIVNNPSLISATETIPQIAMGQYVNDTTYINMPLGMIDTQNVTVCLSMPGDEDSTNNCRTGSFRLYPAYDLQAVSTAVTTSACRMTNVPISINVKNVGRKAIPATFTMEIGYEITLLSQGITLRNIPVTFTETISLQQQLGTNATKQITFSRNADMYPWDTLADVRLAVRTWAKLINDLKTNNDTTSAVTVTSKHTPSKPVGIDQTIPYATLATLTASQAQNRPIRWSIDSNSAPFFASTNYNTSTTYSHPNLLFRDTTFYLASISSTGCTSYYSPIHVFVNNPVPYDASVAEITEPIAQVYMDYDTVKVRIKNYGSQTLTSVPVVYQLIYNSSTIQSARETCTATIAPQSDYIYKFATLPHFPTRSGNYSVVAWTDLPNEMTRANDTAQITVAPLPDNTYCTPNVSDTSGLDISRVTFANIDNPMPAMGRRYVNLIDFDNPMMDPITMHRNSRDTMMITCENFKAINDSITRGFITAYIDWNRDGDFSDLGEQLFSDTIIARQTIKHVVRVPSNAKLGNRRLRLILEQLGTAAASPCVTNILSGEIQDYLVNITERPDTDIAILRITTPDNSIINHHQPQQQIKLKLTNMGNTNVDTINIAYLYQNDSGLVRNNYLWTGTLHPNEITTVSLPAYTFPVGSTMFTAEAFARGDRVNTNNTVSRTFHRFHVVTLIYNDDFEASDMLFAPEGTNLYNRNLWQKGTPDKNHFAGTTSGNMAWVTDTISPIEITGYGNISYLYTPVIDIAQIKPDTIRFNLAAHFASGAYMYMEYLNYLGRWVRFGEENDSLPWYTTTEGFNGTHNYMQFQYPLSKVSNDFSQEVQLRFVLLANPKTRSFDGCAIDDLEIGRAKRAIDAGITTIVLTATEPRFGQTIAPRVVIRNFGYDTLNEIRIAYHPEGSALPHIVTWRGSLAPDHQTIYRFSSSPFVVQRTMPDTFSICAYTILQDDIYSSNDSVCVEFGLIPLQNDAGLVNIITPSETVVPNDSLPIAVRLKNFGSQPITTLPITYIFNTTTVTETIDFVALTGNALQPLESFNYTFERKMRAPLGNSIVHIFTALPNDDYIYNDTLTRHISAVINQVDLKAAEIVLNEYDHNYVTVELAIDNLGARRADNFTVGYFFDNDTSTTVTETCTTVIPALERGYHVFSAQLPQRPSPYTSVTAFLHIENDRDASNDTTQSFGTTFTDLEAVKVMVQENENTSCSVFLQVKNTGNLITTTPISYTATINGTTVSGSTNRNLYPGVSYNLEMNSQVPKSSNHQYMGSATVTIAYDNNPNNNQTTLVERWNYVGLPTADNNDLQLLQNWPNPFFENTEISFVLPHSGEVRFFVINTLGEMVYQTTGTFAQGKNSITIDKGNLSGGTYFYGIEFDGQRLMKKMIFQK